MSNDLYKELILEHYHSPHNVGSIESSLKMSMDNPSCGDRVKMSVLLKDDRVIDIKHQTSGCAMCVASASILTDFVKGKKVDDIGKLDKKWIQQEMNVEVSPTRLKCILLPLQTVQKIVSFPHETT